MKWWGYILCVVLIVIGGVSGFYLYKDYTAKSQTHGDGIDVSYVHELEHFSYKTTAAKLIREADGSVYELTAEVKAVPSYDGRIGDYTLTVNDDPVFDATFGAGLIDATYNRVFYAPDGSVLCTAELRIAITYYADRTELRLTCADQTQADFWNKWLYNNGLRVVVMGQVLEDKT